MILIQLNDCIDSLFSSKRKKEFDLFRPIYGYHGKMIQFWKIEFYSPAIIRK